VDMRGRAIGGRASGCRAACLALAVPVLTASRAMFSTSFSASRRSLLESYREDGCARLRAC
jgi:hypothetical protein